MVTRVSSVQSTIFSPECWSLKVENTRVSLEELEWRDEGEDTKWSPVGGRGRGARGGVVLYIECLFAVCGLVLGV